MTAAADGIPPRHLWLAQGMADRAGADLTAALLDGRLDRAGADDLLAACDRCGCTSPCAAWVTSAANGPAPFCRNAGALRALR